MDRHATRSLRGTSLDPFDRKLWKLENFEKFVETREALIRERLESLFAKHPEGVAGTVLGG